MTAIPTDHARMVAATFETPAGRQVLDRLIRDHLTVAAPPEADALDLARREGARALVLTLMRLREVGLQPNPERRSPHSLAARLLAAWTSTPWKDMR